MNPHMTPDQARKVPRTAVAVGERRTFFSTMQGEDSNGITLRHYSAQEVAVVKDATDEIDYADIEERLFLVRASDGTEFQAYEGELNGWYFDTGQWFGPTC